VKAVLDACVLYPTVLREILIGVAGAGLYTPRWSDRILEEWARATRKIGAGAEAQARGDVALLVTAFPKASIAPQPGLEARLHLPDDNDIHVLAVAIAGSADAIITFNARDFPRHVLAAEGITRRDPDGFLWEMWSHHPNAVAGVIASVHATAERLSGQPQPLRAFLKRAGLPRLAKALHMG
jgi:predicted nucleic acid-binding protein